MRNTAEICQEEPYSSKSDMWCVQSGPFGMRSRCLFGTSKHAAVACCVRVHVRACVHACAGSQISSAGLLHLARTCKPQPT
jgi:hypothetical protein